MNGFLRTLIFIVLVLCFIVAANTTLQAITVTGAEIALRFNDGTDRLLFRRV